MLNYYTFHILNHYFWNLLHIIIYWSVLEITVKKNKVIPVCEIPEFSLKNTIIATLTT